MRDCQPGLGCIISDSTVSRTVATLRVWYRAPAVLLLHCHVFVGLEPKTELLYHNSGRKHQGVG